MKKRKTMAIILAVVLLMPMLASAIEVDVHGFMTSRYSQTDEDAFYLVTREKNGINKEGSFYGTRLGLNFSSQLSDNIRLLSQLIASSEYDSYVFRLDWAFLNIHLNDSTQLRFGKIKFPVGLLNEYIDVGMAYPWIQPPEVIYVENAVGPNVVRESYSGGSIRYQWLAQHWRYEADFFTGQVDLENMTVKEMLGLTVRADWDDIISFQFTYYTGEMTPDTFPVGSLVAFTDGNEHEVIMLGFKVDWQNIIGYAEASSVHMHMSDFDGQLDSDSWYAMLGYQMGDWLPHLTFQEWHQHSDYGQHIMGLGLNYFASEDIVIKLGYSVIESKRITPLSRWEAFSPQVSSVGLFDRALRDDSTRLFSVAIETVF